MLPSGKGWDVTVIQIVNALGGKKALRTEVRTAEDLHATILAGLPYKAFEAVTANYGLDKPTVILVLHVPSRTLARRKQKQRFQADESDRLARVARAAALAEEVLGSTEKAGRWLQKPNRALAGAIPLAQLTTEVGARQVEEVLGRIAHGVFS
jgi:putative toxin-antitoxin system antitoxin component (TIGR02293 family)